MKTSPFFTVFFVLIAALFFCADAFGQNDTTDDSWHLHSNNTTLYTNRDTSTTHGNQRVAIGNTWASTDFEVYASTPDDGIGLYDGRLGLGNGCSPWLTFLKFNHIDACRGNLEFWTKHGFWADETSSAKMILTTDGLLAVGVSQDELPFGYKLAVGGKAIMEDLLVDLQADWPDYVFENAYQLPSIEERASFYTAYHRLPNFQSAKEMDNKISVHDITIRQQEAIEENAIYITQLHEQNKTLKAQNEAMKKDLEEIKQLVQALSKK